MMRATREKGNTVLVLQALLLMSSSLMSDLSQSHTGPISPELHEGSAHCLYVRP